MSHKKDAHKNLQEHRADNYIINSIAWSKKQGCEEKIYLVTSDKSLGLESGDYGVEVVLVSDIEPLLSSLNCP
jgi:hypothetical protein